jgi:hypothetical protein
MTLAVNIRPLWAILRDPGISTARDLHAPENMLTAALPQFIRMYSTESVI